MPTYLRRKGEISRLFYSVMDEPVTLRKYKKFKVTKSQKNKDARNESLGVQSQEIQSQEIQSQDQEIVNG